MSTHMLLHGAHGHLFKYSHRLMQHDFSNIKPQWLYTKHILMPIIIRFKDAFSLKGIRCFEYA